MFALSSRVIVVICVVFSHCYAIHIAFSNHCLFALVLAMLFMLFSRGFIVTLLGLLLLLLLLLSHCLLCCSSCSTIPFTLPFFSRYSSCTITPLTLLFLQCCSSCVASLLALLFLHYYFSRIALLRLPLLHFKSPLSCYFFHIIVLFAFHVPIGPTFVDFSMLLLLFSYCCCLVSMVFPFPLPCESWNFHTNLGTRGELFSTFSKFFEFLKVHFLFFIFIMYQFLFLFLFLFIFARFFKPTYKL